MPQPLVSRIRERRPTGLVTHPDLTSCIGAGPWLCVSPHDDDVAIGMGMIVAAACAAGIEVHIGVVSDGSMGYPRPEDRANLAATRHHELIESSLRLGVPASRVHELSLPDGQLTSLRGAHQRPDGNHTGVGWAITKLMRKVRPRVVFGPSPADIHPDHQAVSADLDIACFWSSSALWLELGKEIPLPVRYDYAVYAPFPADPQVCVDFTPAAQQLKAHSFAAYVSQQYATDQIIMKRPVEYLRRTSWAAYAPTSYDPLFP
ncbi:MAG: PIG-L family deacetylase [Planctomycetota bacterium]